MLESRSRKHKPQPRNAARRPKDYFLQQLVGKGVRVDPKPLSFKNPDSKITCVALKYRTTDELPEMYDKPLLKLMYEGSLEEIREKVAPESRVANAQNATGETVLMKCCRRALYTTSRSPLAVVSLLLKSGADPMVCCDSGKNVLHDLFWSAKPPPPDVLEAMETMVDMLHESTGKEGLLELMLSEDKHGYTPLDYVVPEQQPNWRKVVDTVVAWAASDAEHDEAFSCVTGPPGSQGNSQTLSERVVSNLELVTEAGSTVADFMRDMEPADVRVVAQLCARRCSFLVSDCSDPDAAIIAVSPAFVDRTGYEPEDVLGRNCRFLQGPGTSVQQVDRIRRALATRSTADVSLLNYRKDGTTFTNRFLLTPLRAAGQVRYYVGIQNCPDVIADDRRRNVARLRREGIDAGGWIDDEDEPSTSAKRGAPSSPAAPDAKRRKEGCAIC